MRHPDRKLRAIAYAVTAFSGIALPIVWFGESTVNNTGLGERERRSDGIGSGRPLSGWRRCPFWLRPRISYVSHNQDRS